MNLLVTLLAFASIILVCNSQETQETEETPNGKAFSAFSADACPVEDAPMPGRLEENDLSDYVFLEQGIQIFLDLEVPCTGFVTEFRFLSDKTTVYGLHLAVFRRALANSFRLIEDMHVDGYSTNTREASWVIARPTEPFPVKPGDLIGMFYDEYNTDAARRQVTVRALSDPPGPAEGPSRDAPQEDPPETNTVVFPRSGASLSANVSLLDETDGSHTYRVPALYVMLSRLPNSEGLASISGSNRIALVGIYGDDAPLESSEETSQETESVGLRFRDLKCNLRPRLDMWKVCKNRTALRYYFDVESRKCFPFLGCDAETLDRILNNQELPPLDRTQQDNEDTWTNNFGVKGRCRFLCKNAINLRLHGSQSNRTDSQQQQGGQDRRFNANPFRNFLLGSNFVNRQ